MTPPMMSTDVYAVIRKNNRASFSAEEPYTVAIPGGNPNYDAILEDDFPNWQIQYYSDMQACLKAISDGNADCTLISNYQYNSFAKSLDQYGLGALATGQHADFHFAINRGDDILYSVLTRTTNLVSNTTVNAALNRYSYAESAVTVSDFIQDNLFIAGVAAAAILALIVIIIIQRRLLAVTRQAEQSRHEVENLNKQVFVDALTHVRNKGGFDNFVQELEERLKARESVEFAVVVCDINGLKAVNDLYGHKEGDICIKDACAKICRIFDHSPVFRVGGDEFVVYLAGEDYDRKQSLKKSVTLEEIKPGSIPASEYISAIDVRKRILIVDDVESNREIMGDLLDEDYEILYASNGVEALEMLRNNKGEIDLVLLDLLMPNKDGRETLAEMQVDEDLMSIPVIVVTVDQEAELDCLRIGAMDFIPKPYPDGEIVKARIDKCIELAEDRVLIRSTERDKLTGLLNKDYFFRYISRLDHIYKGAAGAYSVRIQGMNRQHRISLREEFDDHDSDGTKYIVLLDDGYPIATCRIYPDDEGRMKIGRVVVLPEYRSKHLGSWVICEAEKWILECGFREIVIDARDVAVGFYEKLGYEAADEGTVFKSGPFDCVRMRKLLTS